MKIKEDGATYSRPPPTAPHEEEQIVIAVPIANNEDILEEVHHATPTVVSTSSEDDDGREAAAHAEAAAARAQGTSLIRNHLDHHLDFNPHSSYVTWIATLHPENASVAIDPRFLIPGNPWLSVYEDAMHRREKTSSTLTDITTPTTTTTTTTTVVVDGPAHEGDEDNGRNRSGCCGAGQGFLDIIVGWSLTFAAVMTTFSLELVAMYFLFSIWLCFKLTSPDGGCFGPPVNLLTILPFCICYLILGIFILFNAIVFFMSIFMVELIAGINLLLCTLFSFNYKVGLEHHQRTRRLSHLIRWAFRQRFEELDPSVRGSTALDCCSGEDTALQDDQQQQPDNE